MSEERFHVKGVFSLVGFGPETRLAGDNDDLAGSDRGPRGLW
jgi:hypothetical protein